MDRLNSGSGFDVVFLDSTLGNQDPMSVATKLRLGRSSAGTRFVLMSPVGYRCPSNLFAAHLTKPLKPAHVRDALIRLTTAGKQAAPQNPPASPSTRLSDSYPMRVLLCDDNPVNLKVASRMLSQLGYQADVAGNGVEALKAFDTQHYNLVFMDVQMPEMDGIEATGKLRERGQSPDKHPHCQPQPVIVAMTASAMPGDRERCLKAGMDDYLSKPVRPDDLRKTIERWGAQLAANLAPTAPPPLGDAETGGGQTEESGPGSTILDWERLMDLADNDRDMLKELVSLYIEETEKQLNQLGAAVASQSAPEVKRLAHKCAGGSATIGVGPTGPTPARTGEPGGRGRIWRNRLIYEQAQRSFRSCGAISNCIRTGCCKQTLPN